MKSFRNFRTEQLYYEREAQIAPVHKFLHICILATENDNVMNWTGVCQRNYLNCSSELSLEFEIPSLNRIFPSCKSLCENTTGNVRLSIVSLIQLSSLRKSMVFIALACLISLGFVELKFAKIASALTSHRSIVFHSHSGSFDTGMLRLWIFAIFSAILHDIFGSLNSDVDNGLAYNIQWRCRWQKNVDYKKKTIYRNVLFNSSTRKNSM